MVRVCIESGCPRLTRKTRCAECERAKDKARGSSSARWYDYNFEQAKLLPDYLNATHCAECGEAFSADNPKTGGHSVALRRGGKGSKIVPHCRRCNYGWTKSGL